MARNDKLWFEFCGIRSSDMDCWLTEYPERGLARAKGIEQNVSGRNGTLWIPENAREDYPLTLRVKFGKNANINFVRAWLAGIGNLVICDEPSISYREARLDKHFEGSRFLPGCVAQRAELHFLVSPYRYVYPEIEPKDYTASGAYINNPGTAPSAPRIIITGEGDFTVTINAQLMEFKGVTGGIIVDSDLMDCLNMDGITPANHLAMMDEYPLLQPGDNVIRWTGDVAKVTITPRWRYV